MPYRRKTALKEGFASAFEKDIWDDAKQRGIEIEYEPFTFHFRRLVKGTECTNDGCTGKATKRARYTPDFRINNQGTYIESKGRFTADNRAAMESFIHCHPGVDLRFIFERDNWMTNKHVYKYSDWCKKLGLKFSVGRAIPSSWVDTDKVGSVVLDS